MDHTKIFKFHDSIKSLIKPSFYSLLAFYCHFKINSRLKSSKNENVYLFDIDNTLADTFHSYSYHYPTYENRLSSLAIFIGMRRKIIHLLESKNSCLFLSARRLYSKKATVNWLLSNGIKIDAQDVFCLKSPKVKIEIISRLVNSFKIKLILIDDFSYNHENGEVKFYQNCIDSIKKLNVEHIDASQINKINEKFGQ